MKRFTIASIYRGIQIHKVVYAKSIKEASLLLDSSIGHVTQYGSRVKEDKQFDGVYAYMDSDRIIFDEGRQDLYGKLIPFEEMKVIIDKYQDKFYNCD